MMTPVTMALILGSVALSAIAQICLKHGMSDPRILELIRAGDRMAIVLGLSFQPFVIGGLALYGAGAVAWLFVLAKLDVSMAYPFVGLGFILTMLLGMFVLGEQLTLARVAGTLLVVGGVVLIART